MSLLVVTGTGTGVGKTIATAALACAARSAGLDVAVCKPVQTGTADGDDDLAEIGRLSGVTELVAGARYPEPLAPAAAAQRAGLALPTREQLVSSVKRRELTLVEGAGGLLVELGAGGVTLRDLAQEWSAPMLVVVAPGLGTLNHTALTLEALDRQGVSCAGLVIGSWPADPGVSETTNHAVLSTMAPLRATLPEGAGRLSPMDFAAMSTSAFDAAWVAGLVA